MVDNVRVSTAGGGLVHLRPATSVVSTGDTLGSPTPLTYDDLLHNPFVVENLVQGKGKGFGDLPATQGSGPEQAGAPAGGADGARGLVARFPLLPDAARTPSAFATLVGQSPVVAETVSPKPSVSGQTITVSATVRPALANTATPTGTVQFFDGAVAMGAPVPLDAAGAAVLTTSGLAVGDHHVAARYAGDATFTSGVSAPVTQTVGRAPAAVVVASIGNPTYASLPVTFTASTSVVAPAPSHREATPSTPSTPAALSSPVPPGA